jgi:predicted TIM-barrel fold metal-dependent hydrolase
MKLSLYILAALTAWAGAAGAAPRTPIIDMHLHALHATDQGPPPVAICAPYQPMPTRDPRWSEDQFAQAFFKTSQCKAPIWSPATDEALRARSLRMLRKYDITAVASGPADVVEAWRQAAPDRIIPGLAFGWSDKVPVEDLRVLHKAGRLQVLGELGFQYDGVSPDDPRLEPYWSLAEELDIPVAVHVGPGPPGAAYLPGLGAYRARLSSPLLFEDVLVRHPRLRLYVMHAGWPMADDMIALLYAHPQVYVDTGVIDYVLPRAEFHRYLRRLVEAGFGKRILFGSDQMVWPGAIPYAIEGIQSATFLTPAQKRDILHDNAVRFLRLDAKAKP